MFNVESLRVGHVALAEGVLWIVWFNYWGFAARGGTAVAVEEPGWARTLHLALMGLAFLLLFAPSPLNAPNAQVLGTAGLITGGIGILLTLAGLSYTVLARAHLAQYWSGRITLMEGHKLVRSGPYAQVRHPIYFGVLLAILGRSLSLNSIAGWAGLAIAGGAYAWKVRGEERVLGRHFGDEYVKYRAEVKALIPKVW